MNQYRVDRSDSSVIVPVGMNSLLYIGDNWNEARKEYNNAMPGKDAWNQDNSRYGVILSVWNGSAYVVKCSKGF